MSRRIRRRMKEERWNRHLLLGDGRVEVDHNLGAPSGYIPMVNPAVVAAPTLNKARNEEFGRRIYIAKKRVSEFGATLGCTSCLLATALGGVLGEDHLQEWKAILHLRSVSKTTWPREQHSPNLRRKLCKVRSEPIKTCTSGRGSTARLREHWRSSPQCN